MERSPLESRGDLNCKEIGPRSAVAFRVDIGACSRAVCRDRYNNRRVASGAG